MAETFNHGYALLIGVGESQYAKLSLPVTVKDTQAIYEVLTDRDLCGYPPEQIRVLNNAEATRDGILQGLNWLKAKVESDREATVIVYYSGHGWVDKFDNCYYLIQNDAKPSKLAESALSAEVFTNAIREIEAERLLVVIDSCHAAGMATSKDADAELMDEFDEFERVAFSKGLIDDLKRGKGRVVFTSSEGYQNSWILKDQSLSIYTFHFLEALQGAGNQAGDRVVRVSNLMNYLGKSVPETTRQVYDRDQTPHFDFDTGDFAIALLRGGKGLPEKGWDEVRSEVGQKVNKIADKIVQKGKFITNINEANGLHIGDNFYGGDRSSHKSVVQKGLENVQVGGDLTVNISQNVTSETVKRELENLLYSRSDPSSIRAFLKKHPEIIQRAFDCEIDSWILWDCPLNNHIFDICISKYYPTTHRHSWRVVQFGIVDGDILNSIDQCIVNINQLRNWVSQNLKIARESLPDFKSDFFGDIVLGRRINLSHEVLKKITWTNDNLVGIRIRTYDWILQETANL